MLAVQLQRSVGGGQPLGGPLSTQVAVGGSGDHPDKPGPAGGQQGVGIGVAFQHGQVGVAEVAGQRAAGQQLAGQVLDPALVGGGLAGEPVGGADPAVQRRPVRVRQHRRVQPGRVDQRQRG
jgi:hypothetical protein